MLTHRFCLLDESRISGHRWGNCCPGNNISERVSYYVGYYATVHLGLTAVEPERQQLQEQDIRASPGLTKETCCRAGSRRSRRAGGARPTDAVTPNKSC